jgi:hypothetical protein
MPDRKLEYWYDWQIYGPDGKILESLKMPKQAIEKDRLGEIRYLCDLIENYPNQALMNKNVWYKIAMLRQRAFKNEDDANSLEMVCKAIMGDGRRRKNQDYLNDLRIMIVRDIEFFRKMKNRISEGTADVIAEIENFLTEGTKTERAHEKRLREYSNYRNVYYAYKKIYDRLSSIMSEIEIFKFFEEAADNLSATNVTFDVEPDGRKLTFVKMDTWYVKGTDMTTGYD